MLRVRFVRPRLMLPVLGMLLVSCANGPKPSQPSAPLPVISRPQIPPLPAEAKQPPTPELCSPTCSAGLRKRLESWLQLPTPGGPQE